MSVFQVEVKGDQTSGYNIEITNNSSIITKVPLTSFCLNNGNGVKDIDEFEIDQQKVNYLDSVKDGANVFTMQGLNIYPKARTRGNYPTFPTDLKDYEKNLLEARNSYLEHTTWLKVKKGSVLDKGKYYNRCLWESGLGYNAFLTDPSKVITVKTFGSYIDPLEKQNADEPWPLEGSSVSLTKSFMKLMGFGEHSSLYARTISNTDFEYEMNIGCGNECNALPNKCSITHVGDNNNPKTPSEIYFSGNNQKKQFLKSNAVTKQKVKFIVVKEWGDKVQVLIYMIYYHYLKSLGKESVIMTTCDMVVFMLCLNLRIPCIYTGVYNPPGLNLDATKKRYSILEFKPRHTPFMDAYNILNDKIKSITDENNSFIEAVRNLTTDNGANTRMLVGNKMMVFSKDYYSIVLEDLMSIQNSLEMESIQLTNKYGVLNETTGKVKIPEIKRAMENIQSKYIIVPFLKRKDAKSNVLTILMTKSYTANKPVDNSKPGIKKYLLSRGMDEKQADRESKRSFYDIASTKSNGFLVSTSEVRLGTQFGGGLEQEEIELFPANDDNFDAYVYNTNGEIENDRKSFNIPLPYSSVFNPEVSADMEELNLLKMLNKSFSETLNNFESYDEMYKSDNFRETIYTLFVYESYINGFGNAIFDNNDLRRIINDYKLMIEEDRENIISNTNVIGVRGLEREQGFKRGIDREAIRAKKLAENIGLQRMNRGSTFNLNRGMQQVSVGGVSLKKRRVKRKSMHRGKHNKTIRKQIKRKRNTRKR